MPASYLNGRANGLKTTKARARTLALWLLHNSDLVNSSENLQIVFNCAGGSATVEIKQRQMVDTGKLDCNLSDLLDKS